MSSYPSRTVLDDQKRWRVITMIANGSSRRVAAHYVGCSPATITRTADRDPDFAAQLATAEQNLEIDALRSLRAAARKERYWRAAAWLLERKNHDDFTLPDPELFTQEQATKLISAMVRELIKDLPELYIQRIKRRMDEVMQLALEEEIIKGPVHRISKRRLPPPLPKYPAQHPSSGRNEVANPNLDLNPGPISTSIFQL
jgi:hypothetical protein